MIVLGLTGSIAMGKSVAAGIFRSFGVPVCDADRVAHGLLAPDGAAVAAIDAAFPGCRAPDGGIDREALGRQVFGAPDQLARLEAIVHPLVQAAEARFLARCCTAGRPLAVLDVPLLFETCGERRMDAVAVVSAPALVQAQRVLRRPGMTRERLEAIRARQMPDQGKRRRADFVIPTGLGRRPSLDAIGAIVSRLRGRAGTAWPDRWTRH